MKLLSHTYPVYNSFASIICSILEAARNGINKFSRNVIMNYSRNFAGTFTGNFTGYFIGNANGGAPFVMLVFICAIALLLLIPAVNDIWR